MHETLWAFMKLEYGQWGFKMIQLHKLSNRLIVLNVIAAYEYRIPLKLQCRWALGRHISQFHSSLSALSACWMLSIWDCDRWQDQTAGYPARSTPMPHATETETQYDTRRSFKGRKLRQNVASLASLPSSRRGFCGFLWQKVFCSKSLCQRATKDGTRSGWPTCKFWQKIETSNQQICHWSNMFQILFGHSAYLFKRVQTPKVLETRYELCVRLRNTAIPALVKQHESAAVTHLWTGRTAKILQNKHSKTLSTNSFRRFKPPNCFRIGTVKLMQRWKTFSAPRIQQ